MAEAAANVLLHGGHTNTTYHLSAPESHTFQDIADILSRQTGKPVPCTSPEPCACRKCHPPCSAESQRWPPAMGPSSARPSPVGPPAARGCWFVLLRLTYLGVTNAFALLRLLPRGDRDKDIEILTLRHQVAVLQRQLDGQRIQFQPADRALLAALLHTLPRPTLHGLRLLVRPETVLRWHRTLIGRDHAAISRPQRGAAGPARCAQSAPWCCAWAGRTAAGATGGSTAN
jgi:hypothetical protein